MNITDSGVAGSEFSMNMKYTNNQLTLPIQNVLLNTMMLFCKIACSKYDIPLKKYNVCLLIFITRLYTEVQLHCFLEFSSVFLLLCVLSSNQVFPSLFVFPELLLFSSFCLIIVLIYFFHHIIWACQNLFSETKFCITEDGNLLGCYAMSTGK